MAVEQERRIAVEQEHRIHRTAAAVAAAAVAVCHTIHSLNHPMDPDPGPGPGPAGTHRCARPKTAEVVVVAAIVVVELVHRNIERMT